MTLTQRFLLNQPQQERIATAVAIGENNTASLPLQVKLRKAKFSEKLSKVFPEANDIFESDLQPTILEQEEIAVPNVQTMFKELNEGKLTDELIFF